MQPNILFICSDQHRFDSLSINGNPIVKTPNLDKLASEGLNFHQAYTPCPVCTPARASLMTGKWSFHHHNITIPHWTESMRTHLADLPTFSNQLRSNGYYLGYVGKWHLDFEGMMMPNDVGFHDYIPETAYETWRTKQGIPKSNLSYHWEMGRSPQEFDRIIRGGTDEHITMNESKLHWGASQVIDILNERAKEDQPFFVRWDPSEPHLTNVVPEPYASMYNPEEIKPWGSFEEQFIGKPYIQRQQIHTWGVQDWRWADWAPIVARYYGEISLLDHEIGRVVEHLEKLGLLENTIIIYTSDHGDLCGSHRMMDKHYVMYDDVVRVPLIAYWSGKIKPGIRQEFVSHAIDLASTICELAGCDIPDSFQGQSLVPLLLGKSYRAREDIYCAYHGAQFGLYSQRMVRDRKWKYVWNLTAEDELYDVETDPWELDNKAGQVEFQDILQSERRRMVAWLEKTKDPLYHTWTDFQLTHSRKI